MTATPVAALHDARGSAFAPLSRQVKAAGLLERRRVNYAMRFTATVGGFAALWAVFVLVGDSWYQTIVAAAMGIAFTQVAFLGHDAGHRQIARTRRVNDALGLVVGDLLIGLCYGWWVDEHNQHHAHPNHEGQDPDIGESVITFTDAQSRDRRGAVESFIARHQALMFFPLLTLEGLNLHVEAITWLKNNRGRRRWLLEVALQAAHVVLLFGALLLVLSPVKALVFLVIQQAVWGVYMGCSFAPNHKGMPVIPEGQKLDFLRAQVLTTRNVRGGIVTDFLLGGLNYQVEHHLFPNMPRANLRKAQPLVKAHCAALDVLFTETSLIGSYAMALRHLHQVGAPLRAARRARPAVA
ncbi:fatty acid desaturase family protein [uncultured Jatrophihabitans sp.]|uniref:fatty acid desaturase family protein n=1 Tax=uncultured Jatrophihabitans sp. TaxID=1610747 RepID=UPI0035C95FF6